MTLSKFTVTGWIGDGGTLKNMPTDTNLVIVFGSSTDIAKASFSPKPTYFKSGYTAGVAVFMNNQSKNIKFSIPDMGGGFNTKAIYFSFE